MKLDEIGKTINEEGLIDVLNNFKYSMRQIYLVVDENGNAVNDIASMIDENQYLHINGNHIELVQPRAYRLERGETGSSTSITFFETSISNPWI